MLFRKIPVGSLNQSGIHHSAVRTAEAVQHGQGAARGDFEDCATAAGAARASRPVEVAVGAQHQPSRRILAVCAASEAVQSCQGPAESDAKYCASGVCAPILRGSV
jgi:hypothetical protein